MLSGFLPRDSLLVELMPYHFGDPTYARLASAFNLQCMHVVSEPVRKLQVRKKGGREGGLKGSCPHCTKFYLLTYLILPSPFFPPFHP
jgi:hypothetical protein